MSLLLAFAVNAAAIVVVDEGFERYALGSVLAGQGNWVGPFFQYAGDPRDTQGPIITNALVSSGEKAARWQVMPGSDGHFVTVSVTFPLEWTSGTAVMYVDVAMDATNGPGNFCYFQIHDSSGREATRIYLNRGAGTTGDIHLLGRSGGWQSDKPLWLPKVVVDPANNVFYRLKLVIDVTNRKYDCYVGDGDRSGVNEGHWGHFEGSTLVLDGTPAVKDLYFYYGATGLARFTWLMYRFGSLFTGPAYVYCDNIYIEGPDIGADVRRTEIWVARGTYVEQVRLREFTHIYGGFAGNEKSRRDRVGLLNPTIIDAGSTSPGSAAVTCAPMSSVDGFVIRGGYYGIDCAGTSPAISNNVITANVAAGVKCTDGAPLVLNNTIVGNGVGVEASGSARVVNNIVAYNSVGVSVTEGNPVLSHNNVFGNSSSNYAGSGPGAGDISCDPGFRNYSMGDLRLQLGSPCIDRGDPEIAPVLDGYGGLRPVDGDGDGFARVDVGAFESQFVPPYKELAELRMAADGELMRCEEVAVTKAWNDFFYVESLDRTAGVRVEKPGHGIGEGSLVNVSGTVRTRDSGERYVEALAVADLGSARVSPLGMIGKAVGGSDFYYDSLTGAGQRGVVAYRSVTGEPRQLLAVQGLNNIGLLVRVWGRVTGAQANFFYLDDGSGLDDGDPQTPGIRVQLSDGCESPDVGSWVCVTGVCSCYSENGNLFRLILVNSPDDILRLQ